MTGRALSYRTAAVACLVALCAVGGNVGCTGGAVPGAAPSAPGTRAASPGINQGNVTTVVAPANGLTAIAVDDQDQLYLADNGTVRKFPAAGPWPRRLAEGTPVVEGLQFAWAIAVARDGSIWVLDGMGHLFRKTPDGALKSFPIAETDFLNPGLAVDAAGNAYVSMNRPFYQEPGDGQHYIARVTPEGQVSPFVGQPDAKGGFADGGGTAARFYRPGALAFDGAGNLYVADRGNFAIRRVTPDGTVSTVAGRGAPSLPPSPMPGMPSPDLTPVYAGTVPLVGLTVDPMGQLYYTASDNRVHRITPDGVESVFAGDGKICRGAQTCSEICPSPETDTCDRDGVALMARFMTPSTLVSTHAGTLFVLDRDTNSFSYRLRRIE